MNFGLDYENTYSKDTTLWNLLITQIKLNGHGVYLFTMKTTAEAASIPSTVTSRMTAVMATGRRAKADYAKSRNIVIDIWVDNNPSSVNTNAQNVIRSLGGQVRRTQPKKIDDY